VIVAAGATVLRENRTGAAAPERVENPMRYTCLLLAGLLLVAAPALAQEPDQNLTASEVAKQVAQIPETEAGKARLQALAEAYRKALTDGEDAVATAKEKHETAAAEEKPALEKTIAD